MSRLVSVLMPVYNHERYVEEALRSVAEQDYSDLELVVIDDGSTDGSAARVEAFLAEHAGRFRRAVFERQANAGVTRTLNRLVAKAEGDYVTLLASDDRLFPGALTHRAAELDAHPDALAVFTDAVVIGADGEQTHASAIADLHLGDLAALRTNRHLAATLITGWCVPGPVFMARRETYDPTRGVGLYDETIPFEDFDFYLRLASRGRLRFSPAATAAYRMHGANMMHDARYAWMDIYVDTLDKANQYLTGFDALLARSVVNEQRLGPLPRRNPRRAFWFAVRRATRWAQAVRRRRLVAA